MIALAILLGLGWQQVSPEAIAHAKAGITAKEHGDLKLAIEEFRAAATLAPDLAAAHVNLGAAEIEAHDYGAAVAPLQRALALNPGLVGAHQMLGYALLEQGAAAEALPHLDKAGLPDALGIAYLKLGRYEEAVAKLHEALQKRPGDPNLLYYLGRASGLLSRQSYDQLETAAPQSARAHQALAENLAALRRYDEAAKEYNEAVKLAPQAPGVQLELGQVYAAAGDWPKAEAAFAEESRLQPRDAEASFRLGSALLEEGKTAAACQVLQHADQLRPAMPETLFALGRAWNASGNAKNAERAWQQQLQAEGEGVLAAKAHFALAGLYRKEGRTADAAREMQAYQRLSK